MCEALDWFDRFDEVREWILVMIRTSSACTYGMLHVLRQVASHAFTYVHKAQHSILPGSLIAP